MANNIYFRLALKSWGTDSFSTELLNDIMSLKTGVMPLQQGLTQGDMASEHPTNVSLLSYHDSEENIVAKLAVFFTEIISGCSCGDDPGIINGYCEMQLTINKQSGEGVFQVTD